MQKSRDADGGCREAPRKTTVRWRIPAAVVVLTTTVGVVCAPWLLSNPTGMSWLAGRALPELDGDVTFERVRFGWKGPIVLEGIRVIPRRAAAEPLSVKRVEIRNGLAAILASFGDLGRVHVDGMEANVVFDEDGRSNLSRLFRVPPDTYRTPRRSPVRMRIDVDDAVVQFAGPWSPRTWRSEPIDLAATLAPAADGAWSEWTIEPVDVLSDAHLEPAVARGVLSYIAPILGETTSVTGRFSLRLDEARLPVGQPASGTVSGTLALHEVVVAPGPMVRELWSLLPAGLPVPPNIRIADESHVGFRLADRRVTHEGLEFGLPLAKTDQRLDFRSSGSVGIDDGSLDQRILMQIPVALPKDRPLLAALAGKPLSIVVSGSLGAPRLTFDGSIDDLLGEAAGDLIDAWRRARTPGDTVGDGVTVDAETAEAVVDIVGGIVDGIAKRRAERRKADPGAPADNGSRRSRDRRRGGRGSTPTEP